MNKIRLLQLCAILLLLMVVSCREEFNKQYESTGRSTIDKNIVQVLREDPDFSLFVAMIDRLNLATTLGESAIYTCLAPRNKDVEAYLNKNGYASIESIPENKLQVWVNYHLIVGMYYTYDLAKKTLAAKPEERAFYQTCGYRTRQDSKNKGKRVRLYTQEYLNERASDYRYLQNMEGDGFMIEGVKFSEKVDIDAANGVIHVLAEPLDILPRADEAIAADTSLSIANAWLERYVTWSIKGADAFGKIDTTKIKGYILGTNIADEAAQLTFVVPTNKAIRDFFGKYLEENFYNEYDSIPTSLVRPILESGLVNSYWGMSDITNNPNSFVNIIFGYPRKVNDIQANYVAGLPSSNADIYKLDKLLEPPVLNSVEGGIYINQKRYKEWGKMMGKGLNAGLTDPLQYNHAERTLLVQPDRYWNKFVEDYKALEVDTLRWTLGAGIINLKITNGEFQHRYYSTSYGALLFENNQFVDYKGQKANLLSKKSTWDGSNGSIYEIDNFLNPLLTSDTTQNIYKLCLVPSETFSLFRTACDITGLDKELREVGYFNFTIFAPTDEAFRDAGLGGLEMPLDELRKLLERHIVKRKIFTDGAFSGRINNMAGEILTFSGGWESFTLTTSSGQSIQVLPGEANIQANNGVLHGIATILEN